MKLTIELADTVQTDLDAVRERWAEEVEQTEARGGVPLFTPASIRKLIPLETIAVIALGIAGRTVRGELPTVPVVTVEDTREPLADIVVRRDSVHGVDVAFMVDATTRLGAQNGRCWTRDKANAQRFALWTSQDAIDAAKGADGAARLFRYSLEYV